MASEFHRDALRLVQLATGTDGFVQQRDVERVEKYLIQRFGRPKLPPLPIAPKLPPLPR